MKKYKLIQDYPGNNEKVGDFVYFHPGTFPEYYGDSGKIYLSKEIENYPEFWQKIKEPEFYILQFEGDTKTYANLQLNGLYFYESNGGEFTLDEMLINIIRKVQRASDKEIFTVGDKTNNGTIEKFRLNGDMIRVYFKGKGNYNINLNTLTHIKPLFTTEDGVDIFEGDTIYRILWTIPGTSSSNMEYSIINVSKTNCDPNYWLYFSTREKAQEYIDLNKPRYSKQDIKSILDNPHFNNVSSPITRDYLKGFIRNKLKL